MGITGPETLLGQVLWWVPCPCFSLEHPEHRVSAPPMPGTAVTCWSPRGSDWVAQVSATPGCQEPPILSSVAVNSAEVLRAPTTHNLSAKLLTQPKTSFRGQMLEQRVAGSMPTGQLKKVGNPGQLGPAPQPLVGGEQPPKYLHRHAQIQVLTHPRGTGDIRFLKISSGPWVRQRRLQIIQSPWVLGMPRHTAPPCPCPRRQHPPQQGAHGAALGTPHPVFHSSLFSPCAPSAEPHTRH